MNSKANISFRGHYLCKSGLFIQFFGRFYFNKEKHPQPYVGARAGVALTSDIEGSCVIPNLGFSYNLGGKKMVFGTLGYMLYRDYFAESIIGDGRISATIGFAF